jgi:hypothetical protein
MCRKLAFSLEEIGYLLSLWRDRTRSAPETATLANHHAEMIEAKQKAIGEMTYALRDLANSTPDRQLHRPGSPARGRQQKGGEDHAIGRSCGGLSTKINVGVDQDGLPLRIVLSAGQASDKAAVAALIEGLPPAQALIADRGYNAQAILDLVAAKGGVAHIPTQRDRKRQRSVDREL